MRRLFLFPLLLGPVAVTTAWAAASPPPRGPLAVFVRARADETMPSPGEMDARKTKADSLRKSFQKLADALRKQHGKKLAAWPTEAKTAYYEARDAYGMAWSANYYVARPAQEKADSVEDLKKHLAKAKADDYVVLAASADAADFVVEIVGRKGMPKFVTGVKSMAFDLLPGKVTGETLAKVPREFEPWHEDRMWILHWAMSSEPYCRFEVVDTERWVDVAAYVRITVEELVKLHYELLRPAP